jgi:hypothetical protein
MPTRIPSKYHSGDEKFAVIAKRKTECKSKTRYHDSEDDTGCCSSSSSSFASVPLSLGTNAAITKKYCDDNAGPTTGNKSSGSSCRSRRRSKTPSWSDSSGSTYVSGMQENGSDYDYQTEADNEQVSWTASDAEDLDAMLEFNEDPQEEKKARVRINEEGTALGNKPQRQLEWVKYYCNVDETSNNSDLSTMKSLQKEDAKSIFCRRMIPLNIPAETGEDEISGVSIANDPSEVINLGSSNVPMKQLPLRLKNVDYLTAVDVATDHQDISTVGYKIPYQIAHDAFDRTKRTPPVVVSFEVPHLIEWSDTHSTLSSLDCHSYEDSDNDEAHDDDGGSDEATRHVMTMELTSRHESGNVPGAPEDKALDKALMEENDESSSDARIRDLKKKIRELQGNSSSGKESRPSNQKTNDNKRRPLATDLMDKRILELTRTTKEIRKKRGANYVNDPSGGLKLSDPPTSKYSESDHINKGLPSVKVRISERTNSLAVEKGPLPIAIPAEKEDDVSTMGGNDDLDTFQGEEADIENALRSAIERKRTRARMNNKGGFNRVKREATFYMNKGKEVVALSKANDRKRQPAGPIEEERQSALLEVWEKYMDGRSTGERVLIVVITLSLFVLFVLLIGIFAGE